MTPWQVGFVSTVLRALARDDRAAMRLWVEPFARPWSFFFDRVDSIARIAATPWCREALAPWSDDRHPGPRTFALREDGPITLARFGARDADAIVLVIKKDPDAKLTGVRVIERGEFEFFGATV